MPLYFALKWREMLSQRTRLQKYKKQNAFLCNGRSNTFMVFSIQTAIPILGSSTRFPLLPDEPRYIRQSTLLPLPEAVPCRADRVGIVRHRYWYLGAA